MFVCLVIATIVAQEWLVTLLDGEIPVKEAAHLLFFNMRLSPLQRRQLAPTNTVPPS